MATTALDTSRSHAHEPFANWDASWDRPVGVGAPAITSAKTKLDDRTQEPVAPSSAPLLWQPSTLGHPHRSITHGLRCLADVIDRLCHPGQCQEATRTVHQAAQALDHARGHISRLHVPRRDAAVVQTAEAIEAAAVRLRAACRPEVIDRATPEAVDALTEAAEQYVGSLHGLRGVHLHSTPETQAILAALPQSLRVIATLSRGVLGVEVPDMHATYDPDKAADCGG
jgi:hypothetical protein